MMGRSLRPAAGRATATAGLAAACLLAAACAVNPATGERQLALIGTEEEVRMGRQAAQQVQATMGLYEGEGLAGYVEGIGTEMAEDTERPDLPWSFAVADEPVVNAFALPGGFIYLTRGIMAHFNSEAEMAAVLGHEIGHVTARHSVEQMSRQRLARFGLGLGTVLSEDVARFSDVLGAGLGVLFLKYSRDDESQADRLGLRYLVGEGYAPDEMVDVFQMFRRQSEAAGGSGVPSWLSTHPTPASRIEQLRAMIDTLPRSRRQGTVDREAFLRRLEGMVYGPDPRHGYFREGQFVHPELEVRIDFPPDWAHRNMARLVVAASPDESAQLQLAVADTAPASAAARALASGSGVEAVRSEETRINGFPAVVTELVARGERETVRALVAFVDDGPRTYRLLGVAPQGAYGRHEEVFRRFVGSFDRLEDPAALAAEPLRIELVTPERETTVARLRERRASPLDAGELALLNALEADERVPAGRTLKWVVGELPEAMER